MRRISGGDYRTLDGRYRIVRGWGLHHTDRFRHWVVLDIAENGDTEVIGEAPTLRAARLYLPDTEQ